MHTAAAITGGVSSSPTPTGGPLGGLTTTVAAGASRAAARNRGAWGGPYSSVKGPGWDSRAFSAVGGSS